MNRMDWRAELSQGLSDIIRSYLYGNDIKNNCENLGFRYIHGEGARHNYQRDIAQASAGLSIYYRERPIAHIDRIKKRVELVQLKPSDGSKTYFTQKVLEKLLYYDFMDLRVVK